MLQNWCSQLWKTINLLNVLQWGTDWIIMILDLSIWASQVVLVVKNPPANLGDLREAGSIPRQEPLKEGRLDWRTTWLPTPVILPGESPQTEEPGGLQSIVSQGVRQDWSDLPCMHAHTYIKNVFNYAFLETFQGSGLVTQSCMTICDPRDWSIRLLCPWDSPDKDIGEGCHFLLHWRHLDCFILTLQ